MITSEITRGIINGNKLALSKGLTLVESTNIDHRNDAQSLITELLPHSGNSLRIGITGAPGVGKSSFIEGFGKVILEEGKTLAVLTIDPTSPNSGGSILGDKTRMQDLSTSDQVMIRPSPSGLTSGGISGNTRDQVILCEAAGYDVVVIETVGTGQGETAIGYQVDFLLLLLQAGGGDELQGIKRGIMEISHGFAFTKSDVTDQPTLNQSMTDLRSALHLLHSGTQPGIFKSSAVSNSGIAEIWKYITDYAEEQKKSGYWQKNRVEQELNYFDTLLKKMFWNKLMNDPTVIKAIEGSRDKIRSRNMTPLAACEAIIKNYLKGSA